MFKLSIETTNDAFSDDAAGEIADILRKLSGRLSPLADVNVTTGTLFDVNGNAVGSWELS